MKDDNGDLLAESHNIFNRQKNYFCQLFSVHGINNVRQTERHIAEQQEPEPTYFEVKITTGKVEKIKTTSY
jgi:hypothetical protein